MYCRRPDGVLVNLDQGTYQSCANGSMNGAGQVSSKCGGWKFFYANCPKTNTQCSGLSGAWVPAITVCQQQLF
jgi:hypothetical protein